MITVTIEGVEQATAAAVWCNNHFGNNWALDLMPFVANDPAYTFKFHDEHDASHFALRWL